MLMNHNNFRFTEIPDKTNDVIFLKNPKCFWVIFGHFCQMRIFSQKIGPVTHNYIWAPNSMLSFRKKLMSQFRENLRTDRRTDGRTLFYRTLLAETCRYQILLTLSDPWDQQKTYGVLILSERIEVNQLAYINLTLKATVGDNPLQHSYHRNHHRNLIGS